VDEYRGRFGVEPICRGLGVWASASYHRTSGRRSPRALEGERLLARIAELHAADDYAYGYRRMWKTLRRAGEQVPRFRVQRLMKSNGIRGRKRRDKPGVRRSRTRRRGGVPISSSATSAPRGPTSSESPTSPTCAAGRDSSSSRS